MGAPLTIEQIIANHHIAVNLSDAGTLEGLPASAFARVGHKHKAEDITSGTLSPDRLPGGTTGAKGIVQLSSSLNSESERDAATPKAINSLRLALEGKAAAKHSHSAADITAGTFPGKMVAQSNAEYTSRQIRNIIFSTATPTAADGQNGDVWLKYE